MTKRKTRRERAIRGEPQPIGRSNPPLVGPKKKHRRVRRIARRRGGVLAGQQGYKSSGKFRQKVDEKSSWTSMKTPLKGA